MYATEKDLQVIRATFPYLVDRSKATGSGYVSALAFTCVKQRAMCCGCCFVLFWIVCFVFCAFFWCVCVCFVDAAQCYPAVGAVHCVRAQGEARLFNRATFATAAQYGLSITLCLHHLSSRIIT